MRDGRSEPSPAEVTPQTQAQDEEQTKRFFTAVAVVFVLVVVFFAVLQLMR